MEPYYPAARAGLRASASWCSCKEYVSPEHIFTRVRLLLLLLDELGRARPRLLRHDQGAAAARARQPGGRACQQRRLSAAALPAAGRAGARHRAGRQRRRGRASSKACPPLVEFFGTDARRAARRRGQAGRPHHRQQRAGAGARPQRLRRRHDAPAEAGGRHHARVPAPGAPDRGEPVRHHLSRALLLLLVRDDRSAGRAPRPEDHRRRGADDPRRLAARLSRACRLRARAERRASSELLDREIESWLRRDRDLRALRRAGAPHQAQAAVVPDRVQGAGQAHLRLRRARQGQHAAQLLRHRHRLPRLHGRPQPLQARPLHAGHAHSDQAGRGDRRGQARLPARSCPGT